MKIWKKDISFERIDWIMKKMRKECINKLKTAVNLRSISINEQVRDLA